MSRLQEMRRTLKGKIESCSAPTRPFATWRPLLIGGFLVAVAGIALLVGIFEPLPERAWGSHGWLLGLYGIQWLSGICLLVGLVRGSVPGRSWSRMALFAAAGCTVCLYGLSSYLTGRLTLVEPPPHWGWAEWFICFSLVLVLAIPVLVIEVRLLRRALPIRPWAAGSIAGGAVALCADAIWKLTCSYAALIDIGSARIVGILLVIWLGGFLASRRGD